MKQPSVNSVQQLVFNENKSFLEVLTLDLEAHKQRI